MSDAKIPQEPYGAYHKTQIPGYDLELTETGPGTPMGEYMRKFWQPVCLSEELTDVPKAIRIMGEDLVAFRDRSGSIGVMQRHCSHRGTSLEYGIIQPKGIRCCYHGWVYDIDGTILEMPAEPKDSKIYETVYHGAYPAFERSGLVFAYMGPPEEKPEFPEYDIYSIPEDTKLVAFSNNHSCNWLQVNENLMDHHHTALLHNNMTVESVDEQMKEGLNFPDTFTGMLPVMDWEKTRNGHGMCFMGGRRVSDNVVWTRVSEHIFPNLIQVPSLFSTASSFRRGSICLSRWHVPVDDESCILFGWRHFNAEVDPNGEGCEEDCGVDRIDFVDGQCERPYEIGQRAPGDWEAINGQRSIAVHALENPASSDGGVYMCRKLLRELVRGETPENTSRGVSEDGEQTLYSYGQDVIYNLPRHPDPDEDHKAIKEMGRRVYQIVAEADAIDSRERKAYIINRLDELDGGLQDAAE
ncbi:MAG: ring-hydroxylating oxygenase subunit alpha [Alphaproteobacteria bacterium]|nr:ring-hydroxylating oxygenase subunit alpha [Alphaproteobacteria bacterium]|tara:strand:+ start:87 stop:1490 length:1404 start_codon:yes stop_codon:yes gene_type:complete